MGDQADQWKAAGTADGAQLAGLAPEKDQRFPVSQGAGGMFIERPVDRIEAILGIVPELQPQLIGKLVDIEGNWHR